MLQACRLLLFMLLGITIMEEGLDSRQRAPCLHRPAIHAAPSSALVTENLSALVTESLSVSTLVN